MRGFLPVSAIIPCYRCDDKVKMAVDSVLSQSHPPAEIILVDDFSDDHFRTINTLRELKRNYSQYNIKIVELNVNQGPGSARNVAWQAATQPYIAFLDADDIWHPQKLIVQYSWMCRHPEAIMSGHASMRVNPQDPIPKVTVNSSFFPIKIKKLLLFNFISTRSVMLKRNIDYRFLPGKRYAEDYLLWLSIALDGQAVYYLNQPLSFSFKEDFGESGLNGNLYQSHLGVLACYRQLLIARKLSTAFYFVVVFFECIKYMRRHVLVFFKRVKRIFWSTFC